MSHFIPKNAPQLTSALVSTLLLPVFAASSIFSAKLRNSLSERLCLTNYPEASPYGATVILFHAASVGELNGITPLLPALRNSYPAVHFAVTTTSLTGKERAMQSGLFQTVALLPYDHPLIVRKFLSHLKPQLVIFTETELWPNFLAELNSHSIPFAWINGRISDYTAKAYSHLRPFLKSFLAPVKLALVQSPEDYHRFLDAGFPEHSLSIAGCTKYDFPWQAELLSKRESLYSVYGLDTQAAILTAGSVHPIEDEMLITAYQQLSPQFPELQFVLAPRHPEKFSRVADLLAARRIPFSRRSEGRLQSGHRVLLLDTLGELNQVYAISTVAFVGATLVDIGGHNPLEPACFGVPVVVGPNISNIRHEVALLQMQGGLKQVTDQDSLTQTLRDLLSDPSEIVHFGAQARLAWEELRTAKGRVIAELEKLIAASVQKPDREIAE